MSGAVALSGGCLCGAVRFTATPSSADYSVCHCNMCRRWTAGPFMGIPCGDTLSVKDKEHLETYRSSEWAERSFCQRCGTPLFYTLVGLPHTQVSIEAFDNSENFKFTRQLFVEEKPDHYEFANKTVMQTGAEAEAAFRSTMRI